MSALAVLVNAAPDGEVALTGPGDGLFDFAEPSASTAGVGGRQMDGPCGVFKQHLKGFGLSSGDCLLVLNGPIHGGDFLPSVDVVCDNCPGNHPVSSTGAVGARAVAKS